MALASAQIVTLDSSTLGIVAQDFWSTDAHARTKAQTFISELRDCGVFVAFTFTHISELLRHQNDTVAQDRLRFLGHLPLIAWLRPFDRNWFPGCLVDLLMRELHVFRLGDARTWREIVNEVRLDLWETGTGSEIFVKDGRLWEMIRSQSQQQLAHEKYVASIARTRIGNVSQLTIEQSRNSPKRARDEWSACMPKFASEVLRQLKQHGDKRLEGTNELAIQFAKNTLERTLAIEAAGGDHIDQIIARANIPKVLISPSTTVEEIGELAIYAQQLKLFGEILRPPCEISMVETPINTLPAYVLWRRLAAIQQRADRVSGSDSGDGELAVLVLYADAVQVDKRTNHYLEQIKRRNPDLGNLMYPFFRESDYSKIPERFRQSA